MSPIERIVWRTGSPARLLLVSAIRLYRLTLSSMMGGQCRFYPSCSRYAETAIQTRGALVGSLLAAWRILRCNPFGKGGVDPVPVRPSYDGVIRMRVTDARDST